MTHSLRIVIFVDKPDWHARRLRSAFAVRGVDTVFRSLRHCGFTVGGATALSIRGFEDELPDAAFVRCVPGGSFEQVTLRLSVLHALREAGVPVCNDARAIERCVDKAMTSFLLNRAEVATPPTWVCETAERAAEVVAREAPPGHPLVLKPLFGSQGRGLQLIASAADLPAEDDVAGVYYLQRYVPVGGEGWRDVRVIVAGQRPVAAMVRHGKGWITNVKQGAECEAVALDDRLTGLAVAAAAAVGAGYAGVDIIRDRHGRDFVLEINSMPAWSALQRVTDVDIAQALVDSFLAGATSGQPPADTRVPLRGAAGT